MKTHKLAVSFLKGKTEVVFYIITCTVDMTEAFNKNTNIMNAFDAIAGV